METGLMEMVQFPNRSWTSDS